MKLNLAMNSTFVLHHVLVLTALHTEGRVVNIASFPSDNWTNVQACFGSEKEDQDVTAVVILDRNPFDWY